jgi:signal transduction histidine kinase
MFRTVFVVNGVLLLAAGFYISGHHVLPGFGIQESGGWQQNENLWRAVSFIGPFGAALMAFGLVSLATATSDDLAFQRKASALFLVGHFWLSFVIFAKQSFWGIRWTTWSSDASWLLFDLVALPAIPLLFCLLGARAPASYGPRTEWEFRIREIAGQEERNRLAQDLHDSVKQQIYSIHASLAAAQARWQSDNAGARSAVDHSRDTAREAMVEMNALLDRLRQDPLESIGLVEALRRQCEAVGYQTGAELKTRFGAVPAADRYQPGSMTSIFRIAQEALANIARHARPSHISVEFGVDETGTLLTLSITDDGAGFDVNSTITGMGLANMQSRAEEIGARLSIDSASAGGTTVLLEMPLRDPQAEQRQHHRRRVLAAAIPLAPLAIVAWGFPGSRLHVAPLVIMGSAIVFVHLCGLVRLHMQRATA